RAQSRRWTALPTPMPPRRFVLDTILVNAAVKAGAELRGGFSVDDLVLDQGRVTGIRGRAVAKQFEVPSPSGEASNFERRASNSAPRRGNSTPVTERARVVIGADGLHSLVARVVGAPVYHARPAVACYYHSYWSGVPVEGIEVYRRDERFIVAFPTNNGRTGITIGWPRRRFHAVRADIEGHYLATLDLVPGLAERVRSGRREEPFAGTADLPNFFRKPYSPGWALVGDAGYHKDPMLAYGISDAFRDADLLAEALDAGFAGRRPPEEALADYERQRNAAALPLYELNYQAAVLEPPPPLVLQLRAALRHNPEDTARFLGVNAGTVSAREFFAPENVQRILAAGRPLRPAA
ncbi:MAG: NAD(P)/FAD-dependent oxidoreductase, partial [Chloroflexota bacterium]